MAINTENQPNRLGFLLERNHAITVITTLSDWLKYLVPLFQPIKPKPIAPCTCDFFRALSKLQVIARNSELYIAGLEITVGHQTLSDEILNMSGQFHVLMVGF